MTRRRRFTTAAVPPAERLAYWNDVAASSLGPLVVDARDDGFEGELVQVFSAHSEIVSVRSTGSTVRGSATDAATPSGDNAFRLKLLHSGRCRIVCDTDAFDLEAGDFFIRDLSKQYTVEFDGPLQVLILPLPGERFARKGFDIERAAGKPHSGARGAGAVLSSFLRTAWDHMGEAEGDAWPDSGAEVVWDLLERVCLPPNPAGDCPKRLHHRREARAIIESRLSDPTLDVSEVAGALGFSVRYLQLLFAEVQTTPSRLILERRLEFAAERFRRGDKTCNVTEVALDAGFNDLSHFSRAFRSRFGVSPRMFRARSINSEQSV